MYKKDIFCQQSKLKIIPSETEHSLALIFCELNRQGLVELIMIWFHHIPYMKTKKRKTIRLFSSTDQVPYIVIGQEWNNYL